MALSMLQKHQWGRFACPFWLRELFIRTLSGPFSIELVPRGPCEPIPSHTKVATWLQFSIRGVWLRIASSMQSISIHSKPQIAMALRDVLMAQCQIAFEFAQSLARACKSCTSQNWVQASSRGIHGGLVWGKPPELYVGMNDGVCQRGTSKRLVVLLCFF